MPKGYKGFQRGNLNPARTPEARQRSREQMLAIRENPSYQETQRIALKIALNKPAIRERRRLARLGKSWSTEVKSKMRDTWGKKRIKKSGWRKKAWDAWSKYRRSSAADWRGAVKCFTCERPFHWKEMDLGHYKHGKLDFDEMNTNVQCSYCNRWKHGNLDVYTMKLIEKYGYDAVQDLHRRAAQDPGNSIDDYKTIIQKYGNK